MNRSALMPLVRKLKADQRLGEDPCRIIEALRIRSVSVGADQEVVREGDSPDKAIVVLSGFVCSYKSTGEGQRQVLAFYIPGSMPDVQSLHLKRMDFSLLTLTPCELGYIDHADLRAACRAHPDVTAAIWRETLIEAAIYREWMLNVGQREGPARLAHLLCEWFTRMEAVGLTDGLSCEMPLTQAELGSATGFTTPHVNRVLQELRGMGLIRFAGGRLEILDRAALCAMGDFDPAYLHLNPREAVHG